MQKDEDSLSLKQIEEMSNVDGKRIRDAYGLLLRLLKIRLAPHDPIIFVEKRFRL